MVTDHIATGSSDWGSLGAGSARRHTCILLRCCLQAPL